MRSEVLIADDDETIRSILRHKFSAEGFELAVCEDGREAERKLTEGESDPDVAVLDVMMPQLKGTQLLRMIRRNELPVDDDLPVVMLTSRGQESDVLDGLDSGADEYITKPFSPNEVVARTKRLIA